MDAETTEKAKLVDIDEELKTLNQAYELINRSAYRIDILAQYLGHTELYDLSYELCDVAIDLSQVCIKTKDAWRRYRLPENVMLFNDLQKKKRR